MFNDVENFFHLYFRVWKVPDLISVLRQVGRQLFPRLGEPARPKRCPFAKLVEWQARKSNYKTSESEIQAMPFDTTWTSRPPSLQVRT